MANKVVFTNLEATRFVNSTSRYASSRVLYYGKDGKVTFEIYKQRAQRESPTDKFAVIPSGMDFRPDLMSQTAYGSPDFWWKILEANNIKDVFDFKAGLTVRIPDSLL